MHARDLTSLAELARWPSEWERSHALVRTTYAHLATGTPLWRHGKEFELASGPLWS